MDDKKDIVDRLMLKPPLHNLTSYELVEAANEITRLRKELAEIKNSRRTPMTKNKPVKTDTETITKISDFVWELSTEMDTIREQMEDLQIRMLSIRKMLQIMENPKNK